MGAFFYFSGSRDAVRQPLCHSLVLAVLTSGFWFFYAFQGFLFSAFIGDPNPSAAVIWQPLNFFSLLNDTSIERQCLNPLTKLRRLQGRVDLKAPE
jgi:hypothetical protein